MNLKNLINTVDNQIAEAVEMKENKTARLTVYTCDKAARAAVKTVLQWASDIVMEEATEGTLEDMQEAIAQRLVDAAAAVDLVDS